MLKAKAKEKLKADNELQHCNNFCQRLYNFLQKAHKIKYSTEDIHLTAQRSSSDSMLSMLNSIGSHYELTVESNVTMKNDLDNVHKVLYAVENELSKVRKELCEVHEAKKTGLILVLILGLYSFVVSGLFIGVDFSDFQGGQKSKSPNCREEQKGKGWFDF